MATEQMTIVLDVIAKMDKAQSGIRSLQNSLQNLKLPKNLDSGFKNSFANLESIFTRYKSQLEKGFNTKGDVTGFAKTGKELDAELTRLSKLMTELTGKKVDLKIDSSQIQQAEKELAKLIEQRNEFTKNGLNLKIEGSSGSLKDLLSQMQAIYGDTKAGRAAGDIIANLQMGDISTAIKLVSDLTSGYKQLGKTKQEAMLGSDKNLAATDAFEKVLNILTKLNGDLTNTTDKINTTKSSLDAMRGDQIDKVTQKTRDMATEFENSRTSIVKTNAAMQETAKSSFAMANQLNQLRSSTEYFFGLRNMLNLLKRGFREALNSVKELDKAMTATAVVTDFKVGDLWNMLPQYTKLANELGATTQGAYETMTLYYQQGLNQQQTFEIGAETMKMARIAGLDYVKTTDMMTAALRGFNMELDATSAKRINDVYSNLAAHTASNTQEIGEAMERTASIAHSAGMSFESTSAFLAQMIETTREAPENLGTAMKTIIARFQELKKNPLEMEEVDGEVVSYNKIDDALKTIGVDLKKTNGEFRNLDDVFKDIASRWNTLTQTQQRYIATTAAGSRQQSRFIAMMSNYSRTQELIGFAEDSEGASQKQFEKTMESMESKLNRLKNAWQQFTMGIADNTILKWIVDSTTKVISLVNKLIDTLSFGKSGIKSFLSLFLAFKGLRFGGRFVNNLIGGLGGMLTPGSSFAKGYWGTAHPNADGTQQTGVAGKITTPIVAKLNELIGVVRTNKGMTPVNDKTSTIANYKQAVTDLHNAGTNNPTTMGNISSIFNKLSPEHALMAYKNSPGAVAAMKKASVNWLNGLNLDATATKTGQQLMTGIYKGMQKGEIPVQKGINLLGKPALWGSYFGTDVAKGFSQQYVEQIKSQVPQMRQNTDKAVQETWKKLIGDKAGNQAYQSGFLASEQGKEKFKNTFIQTRKDLGLEKGLPNADVAQTSAEQLANKVGALGSSFTSAGMRIQMFGSQLAMLHPALQGIGTLISQVGMGVSTLGMGISAFGGMAGKISGIVATAGGLGPALMGALPAIAVLLPAIVAFGVGIKQNLDIKKEAKEVVENFEEINKTASDNISKLESWRDEFALLQKGVDQNGNNVSLDTDEYDRYREIVNGIAEINPEIVQGYNAQGDAILKNNDALEETLSLQKQINAEAAAKYTSDRSLQKLIEERNINDDFRQQKMGDYYDPFDSATSLLKSRIETEFDIDEFNTRLGFDITTATNDMLSANADRIEKVIDGMEGDVSEETAQAVDEFLEANDRRLAATEDVYKALSMYASQQGYDALVPEEYKSIYENNLRQIAADPDKNAREMKEAARVSAQKIELESKKLDGMRTSIEKAQEEYAKTLDKDTYQKAVDAARKDAEETIRKWSESTDAADKMLAEDAENLFAQALDWTETASSNLTNSFNSTAKSIAAMTSAYDEFKKSIEGTTSAQAGESLGKIIDEMYSGTNALYGGNAAYWKGAEYFVDESLIGNFDKTDKMVKKIKPALEDSEAGLSASVDFLHDMAEFFQNDEIYGKKFKPTADGGFKFLDDISDEEWADMAARYGVSQAALDIIIANAARKGNFTTINAEGIREGYAVDARTYKVKGEGEEEGRIFIKESEFKKDLIEANALDKEDEIRSKLLEKGIYTLPSKIGEGQKENNATLKKLLGDNINKDNWAEVLDQLQYNKDEMIQFAQEQGYINTEEEGEQIYDELIAAKENPLQAEGNNTLTKILGYVDSINSAVGGDENIPPDSSLYKGKELYDSIVGKKGENDTEVQKIGMGLTAGGEKISSIDEFNQTYDYIKETTEAAKEYYKTSEDNLKHVKDLEEKGKATSEDVQKAEEDYDYAKRAYGVANKNLRDFETSESFNKFGDYGDTGKVWWRLFKEDFVSGWQKAKDFFSPSENKPIQESVAEGAEAGIEKGVEETKNETQLDNQSPVGGHVVPGATPEETSYPFGMRIDKSALASGLLSLVGMDASKFGIASSDMDAVQEGLLKFSDTSAGLDDSASALTNFSNALVTATGLLTPQNNQPQTESSTASQTQSNVDGTFNLNTDNALTALDNINKKAQEASEVAEKDKEYKLNTATAETKLASLEKKLKAASGGGSGKTTTKTETKGQKPETKNTATTNTVTTVFKKSGDDKVQSAVDKLKKQKSINIPVYITSHFMGSWTKKLTIEKAAHGKNNHGLIPQLPSFGSLAKGTKSHYGQVGPNNKGGLTLTGEKGYEIAWIPSENRSMILGANGPQMLNLPKEAVVWTHEQSKKILKQDAIPAGSHATTKGGASGESGSGSKTKKKKSSSKKSSSKKSSSSSSSSSSGGAPVTNWTIEEVIRFNIDQSLQTLSYNIDKTTKSIEKSLKKIGTTSKDISGQVAEQVANIKAARKYNEDLLASYQRELKKLDTNYKEKISYSTGTGKKSKSKEVTVNLGSYIKQVNGVYQLDKAAIQKAGPVALQEAITKAASSALSKITSGIDKAQKAIDEQNKKFDDLSKQISENFYEWENKVTQIYDLTKRIEVDKSFQERFSEQVALELSRLKSGFGELAESISVINAVNDRNNKSIQKQVEEQRALIQARREELKRALEFDDELQELVRLRELEAAAGDDQTKLVEIQGRREYAEDLYEAAEIGRQYLRDVMVGEDGGLQFRIDWSQFEADKLAGLMSKETADKVFDYFEKLNDASKEYNDSIKEQSSLLKETYDKLSEYYDYISNMEDTLLKGLEEEIQNEINNTKTLSTAITNALKDLLDEVKRKLDERRKKEDNAKTEADISKKQQRLAMLQADTANSNASEIAKLEKEIADAQQSYERTLEDQLLQRLQDQADKAAKQRERQIEIAQAHADIAKNTDENIEKINEWLMNPEYYKEAIRDAWLEAQGYSDKGAAGRMILEKQFDSTFAELIQALTQSEYGLTNVDDTLLTIYDLLNKSEILDTDADVTGRNTNGNTTIDAINARRYKDSGGSIKDAIEHNEFGIAELKAGGFTAGDFRQENYDAKTLLENGFTAKELKEGNYTAEQLYKTGLFTTPDSLIDAGYAADDVNKLFGTITNSTTTVITDTQQIIDKVRAAFKKVSLDAKSGKAGVGVPGALSAMKSIKGKTVAIQNQTGHVGANGWIYWDRKGMVRKYNPQTGQVVSIPYSKKSYIQEANPKNSPYVYQEFRESLHTRKVKGYKTGGLATETGPAWLHGTPSKPELVLNAQDTRNFIALKDVLSRAINAVGDTDGYGNANFEININVDHVNSDYDVDRIAERVKKDIVKSAGYRNVTSVRKFR